MMEVLLRGHGGDGGATAILVRFHGGHGGAAAIPLRIGPTRDGTSEVLNMLKVSAVPPRRSAVLTVFGGATAINDATTAEPRRSWRCHCDLCRTSTAVAPRLRCDGCSTADARRNNVKSVREGPRFLTRFNKIATQGAPQMAVDKEANSLSRVCSYYYKFNLCLFYV